VGKPLRVIAFLDPESIPLEMLITGAKAVIEKQGLPTRSPSTASLLALIQSPVACQNAITQFQARCLVTYISNSRSPTFRMHDLIQLVVLENTRSSRVDEELFDFAVELVCAAFWRIGDPELPARWPQCELFIPHIQSLSVRQAISSKSKQTPLLANNRRGLYLLSRGRFVEAESLYESVVADKDQLLGSRDLRLDSDTLTVMYNLVSG